MKKIKTYNIVVNTDYGSLVSTINQRIVQGWQPYGSLTIATTKKENVAPTVLITTYAQAIVIYE